MRHVWRRSAAAVLVAGVLAAGLVCGAVGCVNANVNLGDETYTKSPDKDNALRLARKKVQAEGLDVDRYNVSSTSAKGMKNAYWVLFDSKSASDNASRWPAHFAVLVTADDKATIYRDGR